MGYMKDFSCSLRITNLFFPNLKMYFVLTNKCA